MCCIDLAVSWCDSSDIGCGGFWETAHQCAIDISWLWQVYGCFVEFDRFNKLWKKKSNKNLKNSPLEGLNQWNCKNPRFDVINWNFYSIYSSWFLWLWSKILDIKWNRPGCSATSPAWQRHHFANLFSSLA
jgi:hypothetical protein